MSIASHIAATYTAVLAQIGATAVAVVNGTHSTTGIVGVDARVAELGDFGQMGPTDNGVRIAAGSAGEIVVGSEITVDGNVVTVTETRMDQVGATQHISYRKTRPVTP